MHIVKMALGILVAEMTANKAAETLFSSGAPTPGQAQAFIVAWYTLGAWAGGKFIPL